MKNSIKRPIILFFTLLGLSACTTTAPLHVGTVTPAHVYAHVLPIKGERTGRLFGFRCQTRPLFFSMDQTELVQKGVLTALDFLASPSSPPVVGGEKIEGKVTDHNYFLWREDCAKFSVTPIFALNK